MDGKHEVICIEANKVFDFCFQEDRVERIFSSGEIEGCESPVAECEIDTRHITCREVSHRQPIDLKRHKFLICLAIRVPVMLRVMDEATGKHMKTRHQTVTVLKQVVLCIPPGTEVECEVTGNCCCVMDEKNEQINCVFNLCIVIKSKAVVHVLVPTLGMCFPKECKAVPTGCPPHVPTTAECDRDCD